MNRKYLKVISILVVLLGLIKVGIFITESIVVFFTAYLILLIGSKMISDTLKKSKLGSKIFNMFN